MNPNLSVLRFFWSIGLISFLSVFTTLTGCTSPPPTGLTSPTASMEVSAPAEPTEAQATQEPTAMQKPVEPADLIFTNGNLITIEPDRPLAQAIAIRSGLILAVGSNDEVLIHQAPSTQVIDLQGKTLIPGFIDGHTHILTFHDRMSKSLAEAQEAAISHGFTMVSEMWANIDVVNGFLQAEKDGEIRLRVNIFPSYNDGILDGQRNRIMLNTWFPGHTPILDPQRMVRIPGIKIFVDGDNASQARGCWALSDPYEPGAPVLVNGVCGSNTGDLYWTQDELNQAVSQAQTTGYRVAFHAMGDGAIELAINAIEFALDGQPNDTIRHQIEHNSLLRDDLLQKYVDLDIPASVRGHVDMCDPNLGVKAWGAERHQWYANRYAMAIINDHSYVETDFGWHESPDVRYSQRTLDPIMALYGLVTHQYTGEGGFVCNPADWVAVHQISVEKALQMLTISPAYAVSMENHTGSLKAGKFADLVLLSGDPLTVQPVELKDLRVGMTIIGGKLEYCAPGYEMYCPGLQLPVDLPTSGNLALGRSVNASRSEGGNPPEWAVDGNESTAWSAGDFPPQWIEIDLGAPADISAIRLLVTQYPEGATKHRVLAWGSGSQPVEVTFFSQVTTSGQWLVYTPAQLLEGIRFIRVETPVSPSWVGWVEIEVLGTR